MHDTYAPPRCRTSQYSRTFIPFSVSRWNDLANPVFDGVGLAGFKSRANASLLAQAALSLLQSSTLFPFLFFLSIGWYCGAGVLGLIGCISLSPSLALLTFNNNNNNNNKIIIITDYTKFNQTEIPRIFLFIRYLSLLLWQ